MENNFLIDLLIDPFTKEPLVIDSTANSLISSFSGKKYPVIESVPEIIIHDYQSNIRSELNDKFNTKFNYIDHYKKDAELFDYSEKSVPEVTRNELARLRESILREISDDLSIILDVGCGNGWVSKKLIPMGKKVISMDISPTNPLKTIKDLRHKNHAGLIADAYNIPIRERSIDCIIASEILEHVPDPKTFIINLIKLLKNNGKLIITTPYDEKIEYYLCVHCNKPTPKFAHLHSFNEVNINKYLPDEGITWSSKKFSNKYLSRIRSYIILKFLPFRYWIIIDNLFNRLLYNPTRLQIVIKKAL